MKGYIRLCVFAIIFGAILNPTIGVAREKSNQTMKQAPSDQLVAQEVINSETALIKSKSDIAKFNATLMASPFRKVPAFARTKFLSSLVFTENGLGSYSYLELRDFLSVTETYQVLALFGAQQSTGVIPGLKPKTNQEKYIQTLWAGDATDRICSNEHTGNGYKCSYSFGDVCRSGCGQ